MPVMSAVLRDTRCPSCESGESTIPCHAGHHPLGQRTCPHRRPRLAGKEADQMNRSASRSGSRPATSTPSDASVWRFHPSRLETVFVIALLLLAAYVFVMHLGWNFDDSHINFRYVQNLRAGNGWVFNPGERYNASTSVLNPVLTALVSFVASIPTASHLVGYAILTLAAALVGVWFLRRGSFVAAGTIPVMTLCSPLLMETWGIETQMFLGLLLLFVLAELGGRDRFGWVLLGLLVLTRPDGLILVVVKTGVELVRTRRIPWVGLGLTGAVLLPWLVFSLVYFGDISPGTLSSKIQQTRSGYWGEGNLYLQGLINGLKNKYSATYYASGIIAVFGVVSALRRSDTRPLGYIGAYAILQQAAYTVLSPPSYYWYYIPIFYSVAFFALYGLDVVARPIALRRTSFGPVLAGAALLLATFHWAPQQPPEVNRSFLSYADIGRYIRAEAGDQSASIMLAEVGTLAYHAGLSFHVVDLTGLASSNDEYYSPRNLDAFFASPTTYVLLRTETEPRDAPVFPFAVGILERSLYADGRFHATYCIRYRYHRVNDYEYTLFRLRDVGAASAIDDGTAEPSGDGCGFEFRRVDG